MASNVTFDQIEVGATADLTRVCSTNDLVVFAHASGNRNPLHLPNSDFSGSDDGKPPVAPAMWVGALISSVLGNILPGPGTIYKAQTLTFHDRVRPGDCLTIQVKALEKRAGGVVRFRTTAQLANGTLIAEGEAEVVAPSLRIEYDPKDLPPLLVERHRHFNRLVALAKRLPKMPTAVVAPDDANSLEGVYLAAEAGLIAPILIGDRGRIEKAASGLEGDLSRFELIQVEDEGEAAARAVALVHEGRVQALMKGHLHTDDLLKHIVKRDGGLRTKRRISHVFVMDIPGRETPVVISDAAINIAPDLATKVDITQNAIDAALSLGLTLPKVGILSAIETVNPAIPSSLDAAILSKMAERGQIHGGLVDGPLAMDNAIDVQAARTKGITSLVAGHAEVLITPNLEAGNMLAKELTFIAHAEAAGLVVGAKVPVMLTSRADDARARLVSCALAMLYSHWQRNGVAVEAFVPEEDC
ncbi:bifunctional enoyl-CoA hydratase/phosphate acetyltransferase [Roseibium aestuarii]|uniref:Bifunctional enoyl-CoA hydratase/phosphate acetyltransferase n=1 Tax=Roseibium aestuarii TaxID=2600299 RepID=A0ABW4JUW9_9HYPH|nr:bifunctional enoyl-CoA hydratase/phosphate acetyltransferase [Roseibium aestuarii]